jgi:hypothetical protein
MSGGASPIVSKGRENISYFRVYEVIKRGIFFLFFVSHARYRYTGSPPVLSIGKGRARDVCKRRGMLPASLKREGVSYLYA